VGVLYGRRDALDALPTYKLRVADDRFETGTGNFEGWAGSLAAVEYLAEVGRAYGADHAGAFPALDGRALAMHAGMAAIRAYEMPLFGRLLDGLEAIPGVRVWGITDRARFAERTPTAAVTIGGIHADDASAELGRRGIATWAGHFYAKGVTESLGLEPHGVLRIGLTHYNTAAEVDRLLDELGTIAAGAAR
jgi:selenocysteine lyase/cysteine desulfurase